MADTSLVSGSPATNGAVRSVTVASMLADHGGRGGTPLRPRGSGERLGRGQAARLSSLRSPAAAAPKASPASNRPSPSNRPSLVERSSAAAAPPRPSTGGGTARAGTGGSRKSGTGGGTTSRPIAAAARVSLASATPTPSPSLMENSSARPPRSGRASRSGGEALSSRREGRRESGEGRRESGNTTVGMSMRQAAASPAMNEDEALALALAREDENQTSQDEAMALALAREQECADDASIAAALAAGSNVLRLGALQPAAFSGISYEDLLAMAIPSLAAPSPPPARPGPSEAQIRRLPTRLVAHRCHGEDCNGDEEEECPVCFAAYAPGEELRTLPCMHSFHTECIDSWLTSGAAGAGTCPVCHSEVDI